MYIVGPPEVGTVKHMRRMECSISTNNSNYSACTRNLYCMLVRTYV